MINILFSIRLSIKLEVGLSTPVKKCNLSDKIGNHHLEKSRQKRKKMLKLKTRIRTHKSLSLKNKTKKTSPNQLKKRKLAKSQRKKRHLRKVMIKIRISTPWPHSQLFKLKLLMRKRISKKETNLFYSKDFSNFWKPMKRSSTQFSQDISANSYLSWSAENKNNYSHLCLPKTQQSLRIS